MRTAQRKLASHTVVLALSALALSLSALTLGACSKKSESAAGSSSAVAAHGEAHEAMKSLSVDEVDQRLAANDGKTQVFDCNSKETFQDNHVPGAKWVPFNAVTADMLPSDKSTTLVFYCANEH